MNKYVFFREYYKPICMAHYVDDKTAELHAQKLSNEIGEVVIVCRHLTQHAVDGVVGSGEPGGAPADSTPVENS